MSNSAISRFSITQQVTFLAGLFLAGFITFCSLAAYTISNTAVNGPIYGQIIQGKDLVADILPPPEYVIESYLTVFRAIEDGPSGLKEHTATLARLRKEFEERQAYWNKELPPGEAKTLMTGDAAKAARDFYSSVESDLLPALQKGDSAAAHQILHEVLTPQYNRHRTAIDRIVTITNASNAGIEQHTTTLLNRYRGAMLAVVLLVICFSVAISALVIRSIYNTVHFCAEITNRVAQGELNLSIPVEGRGAIRTLLESLNTMTSHLREIVTQVSSTTQSLTTESEQLHAVSQQIASSSDQISAEVSGFAATTGQLTATSQEISSSCSTVAYSSAHTTAIAETSTGIVAETISRMQGIAEKVRETSVIIDQLGERSEQIGQIIETIEDIADQTNLLALNAAIEAARAGEMGRGFAVVADEVRALAERTTRATREITGMIGSIQQDTRQAVSCMEEGVREVENGSSASLRSGEALDNIKNEVVEVTRQIEQIATAAEEQTAATSSINHHVGQIDDAIRTTSRDAHTIARSAAELASMTVHLRKLVGSFSV